MGGRGTGMSRRGMMTSTAAAFAIGAASMAAMPARARAAKYRRINVTDPAAGKVLDSYQRAITRLINLPASDPRNWYRNALVHTVDCPHGNWWFLVWHRGYVGWWEQVVRDASGDPDFAFPYWDWTATPEIPASMFQGVLTPENPQFIATLKQFNDTFDPQLDAMWKAFTPDQINQLLTRGLRFPADLEFDIGYPGGPMFFPLDQARGITPDKPHLDAPTSRAVSMSTLLDALGPRDFITFASAKTFQHSGLTGFGVLEGQPHNKVHNNVGGIITPPGGGQPADLGGFMQSNLSPVDPLFFLHHSNIDRLWDLWTRKQQAKGYPILPNGYPQNPAGSDYNLWSSEPFLFFMNREGKPVTKNTAGDYQFIGDFDYDYQPGSGEDVVPKAPAPKLTAQAAKPAVFLARPPQAAGDGHEATLPKATLEQVAAGQGPRLLAKITVVLPPMSHGGEVGVVVNAPDGATTADPEGVGFAGSLSMFGHHVIHGPVTFTVPLTGALKGLRGARGALSEGPLDIKVLPIKRPPAPMLAAPHGAHGAALERLAPEVIAVTVEAH